MPGREFQTAQHAFLNVEDVTVGFAVCGKIMFVLLLFVLQQSVVVLLLQ